MSRIAAAARSALGITRFSASQIALSAVIIALIILPLVAPLRAIGAAALAAAMLLLAFQWLLGDRQRQRLAEARARRGEVLRSRRWLRRWNRVLATALAVLGLASATAATALGMFEAEAAPLWTAAALLNLGGGAALLTALIALLICLRLRRIRGAAPRPQLEAAR